MRRIGSDVVISAASNSSQAASFFFLNEPAPTDIYPLPLPDPLPTSAPALEGDPRAQSLGHSREGDDQQEPDDRRDRQRGGSKRSAGKRAAAGGAERDRVARLRRRSEEHTSELQSPCNLVCRLLLEKK